MGVKIENVADRLVIEKEQLDEIIDEQSNPNHYAPLDLINDEEFTLSLEKQEDDAMPNQGGEKVASNKAEILGSY